MTEEKLDRRNFFRLGIQKAAKVAVSVVEDRINLPVPNFIRPPFAIDEPEFLVKCTRCQDCVEACPYQTVFSLSARLGAALASTPALDLINEACHLCQDWPCVTACQTGALKLPEIEILPDEPEVEASPPLPRLAEVTINSEVCLPYMGPECGVCGTVCPVPGAIIWDMNKPQIDPEICTGCALCRQICITDPKAVNITSIKDTPQSD